VLDINARKASNQAVYEHIPHDYWLIEKSSIFGFDSRILLTLNQHGWGFLILLIQLLIQLWQLTL
jgi:hypothetical protein